ncbi:MAG TPA: glutamate--tRNA ligase family protein [Pyrinomonadaceae bacterium]|nr:glutamate--tRNA ligase family protein [Pyrinomonadaceae bacterium]
MLTTELIDSLFDSALPEPSHWESRYPPRDLPAGAIVTRFAPSPTGFLHTGGVYIATLGKNLAHHSGGVYFVRIEDTDQAREVAGSREQFARAFKYFDIEPDENDSSTWGPYEQSKREQIYHTYARELLRRGHAYLCFCTREELAQMQEQQLAAKVHTGYYGEWARCRNLSQPEIISRLEAGKPYTIRFRSPDGPPRRVEFVDLIRGRIEHQDNINDIVLLKSSDQIPRLPTYHFAHVVDDHLMRVNTVLRGEEWISSVPVHLQLFKALGFEPIPYAHIAPLMKFDGSSKRKLSKRDNEADVEFYIKSGYPAGAVQHYLRGLANSRFAEMTFAESASSALSLSDCGVAGPIFDLVKLESISREFIAQLPTEGALESLLTWARDYDPELASILSRNLPLARRIFANERQPGVMQRKDLAKWGEFRAAYGLYFQELFPAVTDPSDPRFAPVQPDMVVKLAKGFADSYRHEEDKEAWFEQIRTLAAAHGFAPTAGQYKKNPENFAGSISHVSNAIRIALTGLTQSPELFLVAHNLGEKELLRRVRALT